MAKASATGNAARAKKPTGAGRRNPRTGQSAVDLARVEITIQAAERSGLMTEKTGRISGRVSPALVAQAKRQTGIETDTDLIAFALASVALEDNFATAFKASRGAVDPDLELGF